jgi:shikimate kinase
MGDADRTAARNVVLTGFMGTGKTSVGRQLAHRLGYEFVDTDQVIEERHGPIPEIFREHGEVHFRQLERDVAAELAGRSGLVVATGGRLMVDPVNAERLGATGEVFCLVADVDTIVARVTRGAADRPLLAGPDVRERIAALLAERAEAYARFEQVDTDGLTPDEVATALAAEVTASRDR